MIKTNSREAAANFAAERGQFYGWSVFAAGWYVGTREQLAKAGCVEISSPGGK